MIAVDVGNTAAKLLVGSDPERSDQPTRAFPISQFDWAHQAVSWAQEFAAPGPVVWQVAGVHRAAAERIRRAVVEADEQANVRWVQRDDIPMPVDVEFPDRLGIDRLLGAYAATALCEAPFIVVDAGSAITVDWINREGRFVGGAILPGLRLQTTSLATGTDALPDLDWQEDRPLAIPGRNTLDAIRLGVLVGAAAAVDALMERYIAEHHQSRPVPLIVTGGDARVLVPHLSHSHRLEPNLVCRGLLRLPR